MSQHSACVHCSQCNNLAAACTAQSRCVVCLLPTGSSILSAGSVGLGEAEGHDSITEPDGSVEELIDRMSCAFYSLAAIGTVRVGRLCKGPQLLACWALELLEEQACHVSRPPSPPAPPSLLPLFSCPPMMLKQHVASVLRTSCVKPCYVNKAWHEAIMLLHFRLHVSRTICDNRKAWCEGFIMLQSDMSDETYAAQC